jgi:hypothetical protein
MLFDAVVDMCHGTLLAHIGYRGGGTFLAGPLAQSLKRLKGLGLPQSSSTQSTIEKENDLLNCLQEFERKNDQEEQKFQLKRIICSASRLARSAEFPEVLNKINPKKLDLTTRDLIVRRVKKLYTYQKSGRFLSQSAKGLSIFRNVKVVTVSLAPEWFTRPEEQHWKSRLPQCRRQYTSAMSRIAQKTLQAHTFASKFSTIVQKSKFHAEVQLIAYLELHPPAIKPRVIPSSKAACYLCNLFIHVHGEYHVRKTQGRLYPNWRIPQIPALKGAQTRLTAELAARIKEINSSSNRKKQPYPNESPTPTILTSMPTELSHVR